MSRKQLRPLRYCELLTNYLQLACVYALFYICQVWIFMYGRRRPFLKYHVRLDIFAEILKKSPK